MIEDLRRLYGHLVKKRPRTPLEIDIDRRIDQLIGELERVRSDTWEAELAAMMLEVYP